MGDEWEGLCGARTSLAATCFVSVLQGEGCRCGPELGGFRCRVLSDPFGDCPQNFAAALQSAQIVATLRARAKQRIYLRALVA